MKLNRIQRIIKGDVERHKMIDDIYHKIDWMYDRSVRSSRLKMFESDVAEYKDYALKLYQEFWMIGDNTR